MPGSDSQSELVYLGDQIVPIHQQTPDVAANPGRRKILALVIASAFLPPLVNAASNIPTATAGQDFMALSLFATGRSKLDPEIATKLFAALLESDASFADAANSLAADAASKKYADVEGLETAIRGTPKHATLLALIAAWYTGTVSVKGKPRVITLDDALMYQPIADGSHIPGKCEGGTNSWAQLPYPALADMPRL
jgi:hypothetical protein